MKGFFLALIFSTFLQAGNVHANTGSIGDGQNIDYALAKIQTITLDFCDQVGIKAEDCISEFLAKEDFWPVEFWRYSAYRLAAKLKILETGGKKGWLNAEGKFLLEQNARRKWDRWQPTERSKANESKSKDDCGDKDESSALAQYWFRSMTINSACSSYGIGAQACFENFTNNDRFYRHCFNYRDSTAAMRDIIDWATKNGYRYHSRSLDD